MSRGSGGRLIRSGSLGCLAPLLKRLLLSRHPGKCKLSFFIISFHVAFITNDIEGAQNILCYIHDRNSKGG